MSENRNRATVVERTHNSECEVGWFLRPARSSPSGWAN